MSIRSEIERISNAISAAYQAVTAKGGTIPQDLNLANLLASIASIKGVQTIVPSAESGSVAKQLLRISEDIASAYDICELSGATLPVQETIANLANTINTIPSGSYEWPGWTRAGWGDINNLCVAKQRGIITEWPEDVIVGARKRIRLSDYDGEVLSPYVRIVGRDIDADGTLTFACESSVGDNVLYSSQSIANYYDSSNNIYIGNANSSCNKFYDNFTGKQYIIPVNKGTCITGDYNRNGTAVYREQKVWLASELEIGLDSRSSLSRANSTTTNAECTYGKVFTYPYFDSDAKRTINNTRWFLRGTSNNSVCCHVSTSGTSEPQDPSTYRGFVPFFVIGNPNTATI